MNLENNKQKRIVMLKEFLKISKICKNYENIESVKDVTFTAKKGEIIALLGPNGAGKSTLMNMIAGYLSPTSGDIFVCGKNIGQFPLWGKENIGFLSEGAPLYADLNVRTFLDYMAGLRGCKKSRVDEVMQMAKIEHVANQKLETLSKGYQRRVGFAQSILGDPNLLLLDEPTDGLDPNQKKHIRTLIKEMGKDKCIVISTHLLEEAENLCNRIVLLNRGKIVAEGTLKAILNKYKKSSLEELFYALTCDKGE